MDYDAHEDEDARPENQKNEQPQRNGRMGNNITFDPCLPGTHSVSEKLLSTNCSVFSFAF